MAKWMLAIAVVVFLVSPMMQAQNEQNEWWKVCVIGAKHLQDKDWGIFFRNPDPYIVVMYKADGKGDFKKIGQTKVKKNTEHPEWKQEFHFAVKSDPDKRDGKLQFRLVDKDLLFNDDPAGVAIVDVKATPKPIEVKFKGAKQACLKIHIIAPEKPQHEPPQPKNEKGVWEVTVVEGKHLTLEKGEGKACVIAVGYRTGPKKDFTCVEKIKISKSNTVTKEEFKVKGMSEGTFAFLLTDHDKPGEKEFEKGAQIDAEGGEYNIKIEDTKKGYIEVELKFVAGK